MNKNIYNINVHLEMYIFNGKDKGYSLCTKKLFAMNCALL